MRRFSLTVDQLAPEVFCIGLDGELDFERTLTIDSELRAVERRRPHTIVLDLRELNFVDSSGLGRILSAQRRAARGGWRLVVVRGSEPVQRILGLSALDQTLELVDDPQDALAIAHK
jgi:anti-anti-sigma factor